MTYPIDVDRALHLIPEDDSYFREFMTVYLPLVNDCYRDGREGADFTFMDGPEEIKAWEKSTGQHVRPVSAKVVCNMIRYLRDAYEQGRTDAQTVPLTAEG